MNRFWIRSMEFFYNYWGCHQMPERSFFICKYQLPICARCLGIMLGYVIGIIFYISKIYLPLKVILFLPIITLLDWSLQSFLNIISNNFRRLITGICGGLGIISIILRLFKFIISLL